MADSQGANAYYRRTGQWDGAMTHIKINLSTKAKTNRKHSHPGAWKQMNYSENF